ncbi:MAG: hypothetical protein HYZ73_03385 [Elusimicrobia bacterium]|nr:hypothetical protein [Elusimicrobiota bacterium]
MEERYRGLQRIGTTFKAMAWLVLILLGGGVTGMILLGGGDPKTGGRLAAWLSFGAGLFYFLFFYAVAEVLRLLMDIERNTRKP